MPTKTVLKRAQQARREGKRPSSQAGEFVKAEMHRLRQGDPLVHSRQQAIAIGLSEARRAGVKLPTPRSRRVSTAARRKARRDYATGQGRMQPSPQRSGGAKKAIRTRRKQVASR